MFSTIWYRHWIIAQYCIQGCKNIALMTYVPHRTLTPQKMVFLFFVLVGIDHHGIWACCGGFFLWYDVFIVLRRTYAII